MERDSKNGSIGDASNSGPAFSRADKMRFNTLTYEIIEELKMRRELAVENEKKIEKLINERFNLGWKLDQECGKVTNLGEKHEAELRETRRQLEEKMRDCQTEASQQQVYRKMAEKEKDALKDEIRRLQLANYALEKKVRESERQEKIQANEREQHIHQVSRFESQFNQLDILMKQLSSKQDQLDIDMKHIKSLNKSLQYQNSHQKCVLDMKEADLIKVTQELLDTKVKVKVEPGQILEREEELQNEVKRLKELVVKQEEDYSNLDKDKDSWKEKYWDSLKKLDDAHKLINVHLHNAAKYRDENDALEELQKATQDKLHETKHDLQKSRDEIHDIQQKHKTEVESFETEISKLNEEIIGLNADVKIVSEQEETTKQFLQIANDTIADLENQLNNAMEILNVEKIPVESQTQLQMLEMLDVEVQATPILQTREVQVGVEVETGITQTIDPALCSTKVQTDAVESDVREVQTECIQAVMKCVKDADTQSDLDMKEYDLPFYRNVTENDDVVDCSNGMYTGDSHDKIETNVSVEGPEIPHDSEHSNNGHYTEQNKSMQLIRTGEDISAVDSKVDNERFNDDGNISFRSERNRNLQDNTQLGRINSEKTQSRNDIEAKTRKEFSTLKEQNQTVHQENLEQNRINTLKSQQTGKSILNNFSNNNTESTIVGSEADNSTNVKQKINNITSNVKFYQRGEIGNAGLNIPRIDIARSINNISVVAVDPDEFSIELTQDEKNDIDSKYTNKDNSTDENGKADLLNVYSRKDPQSSNCHQIVTTSFEKSIADNWEVSEKSLKLTKSKAKKHKLTKEVVKDQFSDFDRNKERFKQYLSREEVQPKHPKLNECEENQRRSIPKKQRDYSSMFKVQEEIENIEESDIENLIPEAKVKDNKSQSLSNNLKGSSTNIKRLSQYPFSANCTYKNLPGTSQLSKQEDRELNKSVMNPFSKFQSRVCTDDMPERESARVQSCGSQPDNSIHKESYSEGTFDNNYLSNQHLQQGSYEMSSSQEYHLQNPATLNVEVLADDETDSPNTLTQSDSSSQELNEVNNPLLEKRTFIACPVSATHSVPNIAVTTKSNEGIGDSLSVVAFPASVPSFEESEAHVTKPVVPLSPNSADTLSKLPLNTHSKTSYPTGGNPGTAAASLDISSPSYVTRQSFMTGTYALRKSKSTSPVSTKTDGSTDFLQKYRDIVAKIKPIQNASRKQSIGMQKITEHSITSPGNSTVQDFVYKISPRGRTPRGILKGASRNSRKPRNVTWNEYVLNKDFIKDDNTSDEGN